MADTKTVAQDFQRSSISELLPFPRLQWIEVIGVIGFWSVILVLSLIEDLFVNPDPEGVPYKEILLEGVEHAVWVLLTFGIFRLTKTFNFEPGFRQRDLAIHVFTMAVVILSMEAIQYYSVDTTADDAVETSKASLFYFQLLGQLILYLFILAVGFARNYFHRSQAHLEEAIQLREQAALVESKLAEARLHALRMQLNPHFLFNTLNAISVLVERDPKGVRRMIALLSDLLRYVLEQVKENEVPLMHEIQFLRTYFQIQQIRFQGKLEVEENFQPPIHNALIPSLILQPLAENAIKHGVSRLVGKGVIKLKGWVEDKTLFLTVHDNGPGINVNDSLSSPEGKHIGLQNIRERLAELYGSSAYLVLDQSETGGTVATIALPYHSDQQPAKTNE